MSAEDLKKWSGRAKPGMVMLEGADDIRDAFIKGKGIDWTASYIDPCTWIPPSRTLVTRYSIAFDKITKDAGLICRSLGIRIRDGGPRAGREWPEPEEVGKSRLPYRDAAE